MKKKLKKKKGMHNEKNLKVKGGIYSNHVPILKISLHKNFSLFYFAPEAK